MGNSGYTEFQLESSLIIATELREALEILHTVSGQALTEPMTEELQQEVFRLWCSTQRAAAYWERMEWHSRRLMEEASVAKKLIESSAEEWG